MSSETQDVQLNPRRGRWLGRRMSAVLPCVLVFSMAGCKQSAEQIGSTVKESMQQTFDKDPNLAVYHFQVSTVTVTKKDDGSYDGTSTVNYKGQPHTVPLVLTLKDDKVNWKTAPGALDFAAEQPAPADAPTRDPAQE